MTGQRLRGSLWHEMRLVARIVLAVTRNALISSFVAWVAAFMFSRGNIFHAGPQTVTDYLSATLVWGDFFFTFGMLVTRSSSLVRLHLVSGPDRRAGVFTCLLKTFSRTWWLQALECATLFGLAQLAATYTPAAMQSLRLELYLSFAFNHPYTTWVDVVTGRIYKYEAVEGRAAAARREQ